MIQRIQSVWLLLAALSGAGLFFLNLHQAKVMKEGAETIEKMGASNNFILLMLALVVIALPLVAIFLFKNRKKQAQMATLSILADIGFIAVALMLISNANNKVPAPTDSTYLPGIVLPVLSLIFSFLAIKGIRKDEKLVKSLDRLR